MSALTPAVVEAVNEIIAQLSDPAELEKRFAELRGMAASVDSKSRDLQKLADKYANAEKMRADAVAVLAQHKARVAELRNNEIDLGRREELLATAARELDKRMAGLNAREAELNQKADGLRRRQEALAAPL